MQSRQKEKNKKKIEEFLIDIGLKIARRGEGALFIIGNIEHKHLIRQEIKSFNAFKNPKLLESLALIDGAVILDDSGNVKSYGAMIKSDSVIKNFGTRHSAAISASKKGNTSIIISEEDRKIRIFKEGKMIMQIDPSQKNIEKSVPFAVDILESVGAGTLGTIGTTLLVPSLGIALLPGLIVFGSAYYIARKFRKR